VKKSGYDLVVMGSHGHRGVERALLGSTAERVILNAPCAVLVVGAAA
jgi:nucleotide-binding universal stress UspA family protein